MTVPWLVRMQRCRLMPVAAAFVWLAIVVLPTVASAQTAPTVSATATPKAPGDTPVAASARVPDGKDAAQVAQLRETTARIRALLKAELDASVDPQSLFDVDLGDEAEVLVEARRLLSVVERARSDRNEALSDGGAPETEDAGIDEAAAEAHKRAKAGASEAADAGLLEADAGVEDDAARYAHLLRTDPVLWEARVALDAARLSFYELARADRDALLAKHQERRKADTAAQTKQQLSAAELQARQADEDRQRALDAAKNARSEAVKLVNEELARLLSVSKEIAELDARVIKRRGALDDRTEAALAWQRKVPAAIEAANKREITPTGVDTMYGQLRDSLRKARSDLSGVLAGDDTIEVPSAGADPLASLPAEVDRKAVDEQRAVVDKESARVRADVDTYEAARAAQLMAEVEALNRLRLSLLPYLSDARRSDVTGFGPAGADQAGAEAYQVALTLRYHLRVSLDWVRSMRSADGGRGHSAWAVVLVLLKWIVPLGFFLWWRRRAVRVLDELKKRIDELAKKARQVSSGSLPLRALGFYRRVRGPLEWLIVVWVLVWLLPESWKMQLEAQLPATVLGWTLGGALVVSGIDALASEEVRGARRAPSALQTAHIRLQSLRLLGRAVVVVGLVLSLSDLLVGKGTIYGWVLSTCWIAAIPILLVIVKWWRPVIYERLELVRKKNPFERWVLAQQEGAVSFVAAIAGGGYLFGTGLYRLVRSWVVTFNITRRVLAYLFRRGMSKKAEAAGKITFTDLEAATYTTLGPETASTKSVPSVADEQIDEIITRIEAPGGGVFAVVGERGGGKSTVCERIARTSDDLTLVTCPTGGIDAFKRALNRALGLGEDAAFEETAVRLDGRELDNALLIDDAHHLIRPMMGGLREFDRVLDLARQHSNYCTWIFAIDAVLWRFFEQARGTRPLFDDVVHLQPWSEEGIVRLLTHKNEMADISPSFEHLITDLPDDADEIEVREALERTQANYYRLLWDYAGGNPGVAMHFWRRSLGIDADGELSVRHFRAPEAEDLEDLPDSAVFVLRAIVQLAWARPEDICAATALPISEVRDALRYGLVKGYFDKDGERFHVTWNWFRAITRFLRRRHLLFSTS